MDEQEIGKHSTMFRGAVSWLVTLYCFLAFVIFLPYYNWQYANRHGFVQWLLLGEIEPSWHALVWPYTTYSDRRAANEKETLRRYVEQVSEAIHAYDSDPSSPDNQNLLGRFQGMVEVEGNEKAIKSFAPIARDMRDKQRKISERVAAIAPPPTVREYHSILVEMCNGEASIADRMSRACEKGAADEFGKITDEIVPYLQSFTPRLKAAADKAGLEDKIN